MKKCLGILAVLAMAVGVTACDSSNDNGQDVIIPPTDTGADTGRDTVNPPTDTGTDTGRDTVTPPTDNGTDTVTPPTDTGADTVNPPTDTGADTVTPPTDNGTDTTQPPTDTGVDQGTDPGTTPTCVDEGARSCKGYFECAADCPQDQTGNACRQQCQSNLSVRGLTDYNNFIQCLQRNCANAQTDEEFYACLEQKCISEYYHCFWGCQYQNCATLIGCLTSCPEDNPSTPNVNERSECIGNCWGGATPEAQLDLQAAIDCTSAQCPVCNVQNPTPQQEQECDTCWNNAANGVCASNWEKCASYGTKKCGEMFTCVFQTCQDSACVQQCLRDGTKTAGQLWDAMIQCMFDTCTVCNVQNPTPEQETECNNCLNQAINQGGACESQANACMNDQAAQ